MMEAAQMCPAPSAATAAWWWLGWEVGPQYRTLRGVQSLHGFGLFPAFLAFARRFAGAFFVFVWAIDLIKVSDKNDKDIIPQPPRILNEES
jgi:hypothetical protein